RSGGCRLRRCRRKNHSIGGPLPTEEEGIPERKPLFPQARGRGGFLEKRGRERRKSIGIRGKIRVRGIRGKVGTRRIGWTGESLYSLLSPYSLFLPLPPPTTTTLQTPCRL
ncbi:hypothetical protein, partial [uncultured Akkermansia sp.]|uniref:hypothetical protein n=1 Tax=uncultured Akkermansia sp. TaxID=512294 RepID=UPI00265C9C71